MRILLHDVDGVPITLPPLFCPLAPSVLNAQVEQAHACGLDWALTWQLVQPQSKQLARLTAARLAWVAGRFNPEVGLAQLQLFTDWLTWLICYDDLCDTGGLGRDIVAWGALVQRLIAVIRGACEPQPTDSFACALANLRQRLHQQTSRVWLDRFAQAITQTLQAHRWEGLIRASGTTPDLTTYLKMRPLTSGIGPCFDLMAIYAGVDPAAAWLTHAYLKQLELLASNHISWVNDLLGLAKEIKENNPHNLVLVLQHEYQLTRQAAVNQAVAMCNAEMNAFFALAELFATEEEGRATDCQAYIHGLQSWMRGNLDWYTETKRY